MVVFRCFNCELWRARNDQKTCLVYFRTLQGVPNLWPWFVIAACIHWVRLRLPFLSLFCYKCFCVQRPRNSSSSFFPKGCDFGLCGWPIFLISVDKICCVSAILLRMVEEMCGEETGPLHQTILRDFLSCWSGSMTRASKTFEFGWKCFDSTRVLSFTSRHVDLVFLRASACSMESQWISDFSCILLP